MFKISHLIMYNYINCDIYVTSNQDKIFFVLRVGWNSKPALIKKKKYDAAMSGH